VRDRTGDEVDEFAAPPPPRNRTPGKCDTCGGRRWVEAGVDYLDRNFPWPTSPPAGKLGEDQAAYEEYVLAMTAMEKKRSAAAGSVYPCPTCEPGLHAKWQAGHFGAHHNREDCDVCRSGSRKK